GRRRSAGRIGSARRSRRSQGRRHDARRSCKLGEGPHPLIRRNGALVAPSTLSVRSEGADEPSARGPDQTMTDIVPVGWFAGNEGFAEHGLRLQGDAAIDAAVALLTEEGEPDLARLRSLSIAPGERDEAMVKAEATPAFVAWLKPTDVVVYG